MTEGKRNHFENFGSFPNFDLQVVDSIHGSDSSTERSEGSSNKRKSVSFASEVSFQSISPAISPKKPLVDTEDVGNCQDGGSDEQKEKEEGRKAEKDEKNSDKTVQEQGEFYKSLYKRSALSMNRLETMREMEKNENLCFQHFSFLLT